MAPHEGDIVVEGKRGLCGFASTNLEFILGQRKIQTIALAGFLVRAAGPWTTLPYCLRILMLGGGAWRAGAPVSACPCALTRPGKTALPNRPDQLLRRVQHADCLREGLQGAHTHGLLRGDQVRAAAGWLGYACLPGLKLHFAAALQHHKNHRLCVYTINPLTYSPRSQEAHDAAVKHTFPMFSLPQTSKEFIAALK
jgi:hypothetical protein